MKRKKDLYALFGNPITHSLSPLIHHLFAKQTRQHLMYSTIHVKQGHLAETLDRFQSQGGKGANITSPFKQEAFSLVDSHSQRAQQAHAINTILFDDKGQRWGDMTDGIGLITDMTVNQKIHLEGKRLLILGAGGAARSVLTSVLAENPAAITLTNRTESKAIELARQFMCSTPIQACPLTLLGGSSFDVVIHATSAGSQGKILPLHTSVLKNAFCYDIAYGQAAIPFLQQAKEQGARAYCDGLGMLIEQAAESFYVWRNIKPNTHAIRIYESTNSIMD